MAEMKSFPKFQFALDRLSIIFGKKYCQLFSLNQKAHLIHFEKMFAKYPCLNNQHVCQPFLLIKPLCHGKKQLTDLTTDLSLRKQPYRSFPQDDHCASVFHSNSSFITWDIKNTCIQG